MKILFIVLFAAAVSQAAKIDWDNLKVLDVNAALPLRFGNGRVVGGEEAAPHQFPYQAGLILSTEDGQSFCGGSLISPDSVLTSARCIYRVKSIEVILGAHRFQDEEPTQIRLTSTEFIVYPEWSSYYLTGDLAIVKLPQPVELNENISLVKLPSRSDVSDTFTDDTATVSGWGQDSDSSPTLSKVLRFTSNTVISNLECYLSYPFVIKGSHLCVSGKGGKSTCNGDIGDPLTVTVNGAVKQIGLVSFARVPGCEIGNPVVNTRLTSYLDWINQNGGVTID